MNQLSTDVKTHAIVTYTKSHYLITNKEELLLQSLGLNDILEVGSGSKIPVKNIAEIMAIQDYYNNYPDRRPDPVSYPKTKFPDTEPELMNTEKYRESLKRRLEMAKQNLEKNPQNEMFRFMVRNLQNKLDGKVDSKANGKPKYTPKYVYDSSKESWDEFKKRADIKSTT